VTLDLMSRADDGFAQRLALVRPGQWTAQTPCTEWDVRALVNHVVGAKRRYVMLLHGAATDEVEVTRAVDHLGGDPVASFAATAAELKAAFGEPGAMARTAHHRAGERTGAQLLQMRVLDVAVYTWDLARAIRADESLDPGVVAFALTLHDTFDAARQRGAAAWQHAPRRLSPSPSALPIGTTARMIPAAAPPTSAPISRRRWRTEPDSPPSRPGPATPNHNQADTCGRRANQRQSLSVIRR
jgi:uncharacterized protein (TIGR03086 family)